MGVAGFYADIANLIALQVFDGKTSQTAVDLDTGDLLRQPGQQGGLIARPRTAFKHTVGVLELELLGKAGLDLACPHAFAGDYRLDDKRQFTVGTDEATHGDGHHIAHVDYNKRLQKPG